MNKPKLNFGLVKISWGTVTRQNGVDVYGAPRQLEGSRNFSAAKNGDLVKEWADGGVYFVGSNNSGYNITLELVRTDEEFRKYALNEIQDANGVQAEYGDVKINRFYLLCEFQNDDSRTRRVFYDCFADRPDISGQTYKDGDSLTSQRETLSIVASPRINDRLITAFTRYDVDPTAYDNWFNGVYQPVESGSAAIAVTVNASNTPVEGALVIDSAGNQALTNTDGIAYIYELPGTYNIFASYEATKGSGSVTLTSAGASVTISLS